jgi:iron(III) transport system ATP-binding protein
MSVIVLADINKTYPGCEAPAVRGLDLNVARGETVALLGPSGCGKTTTLRLIAGFEQPDDGEIVLNNRVMAGVGAFVPPERRGVGIVFQDHALFPHLNVAQNVGFGLPRGRETDTIVGEMLEMVDLAGFQRRYPAELSGGQQQRIALARALARRPVVVLLDEPFSSLDAELRGQMRREVARILKQAGATAILVTHDPKDALAVADRVAIMRDGAIEQIDTPREIYQRPASAFVAGFVERTNIVPGVVATDRHSVSTELGAIPCPPSCPLEPGRRVQVSIRPRSLVPHTGGEISGEIIEGIYSGETIEATVRVQTQNGHTRDLLMHVHPDDSACIGRHTRLRIVPDFVAVIAE